MHKRKLPGVVVIAVTMLAGTVSMAILLRDNRFGGRDSFDYHFGKNQ